MCCLINMLYKKDKIFRISSRHLGPPHSLTQMPTYLDGGVISFVGAQDGPVQASCVNLTLSFLGRHLSGPYPVCL